MMFHLNIIYSKINYFSFFILCETCIEGRIDIIHNRRSCLNNYAIVEGQFDQGVPKTSVFGYYYDKEWVNKLSLNKNNKNHPK